MEKNVYLIVPDLHLGVLQAQNRVDYRSETAFALQELAKIAVKYKGDGWNTKTFFLGDIYHNSYKSVFPAIMDRDFIMMWRQKVGECFVVVGNHELSFYQANPFYTLVSQIESERVQKIMSRVWQPLGSINVLRIVDCLCDGEVTFYCNHYGTGVQKPGAGVSIGLFHQELAEQRVVKDMQRVFGTNPFVNTVSVDGILSDYDYCYFGHMHLMYGKWKEGKTSLCYLASLGRTNVLEVQDNFLERCIPAVMVVDGAYAGTEENYFNLPGRKECVVEDVAAEQHEQYLQDKAVRELRNYVPLGDDPVKNLYDLFAEEPMVRAMLDDFASGDSDRRARSIKRKMRVLEVENK